MTASPIVEPVMHVSADDPEGVEKLATKLLTEGLYANPTEFPDPKIAELTFSTDNGKLTDLIASAKGNTAILKMRNEQSELVHANIKANLGYVKPICTGNYELIKKSGFDPSIIPSAHALAPKAVIKKIVKGPGFNTVKVMLVKGTGLELNKRESRSYIVYLFDMETGKLVRTGCSNTDSRKLIVPDVPFNTAFNYSVAIQNAAGLNEPSEKMKFTLND